MKRRIQFLAALAALAMECGVILAQEPAPAAAAAKDAPAPFKAPPSPPVSDELRALHQLVEKQSRQIDELTRQVEKLTAAVEAGKAITKVEPAPKVESAPKAEAEPAPEPAAAPAEAEDATANAPKAEAAGGPKHVIQKGETLTSIAKHYNIPLADLQKANKDLNPAKLQIGQTINLPAAKSPEPSPDKK